MNPRFRRHRCWRFELARAAGFRFQGRPVRGNSHRSIRSKSTTVETSVHFSITSAPVDRRPTFATSLRDTASTRILSPAPLGARARVAGPFGNFTLSIHSTCPAVLLAGGIGITPLRSMVRHLAHEKREERRSRLHFCAHDDRPGIPRPRWRGETGRTTLGMMMRHLPAGMPTELARGLVYYLAGPPGMVRGLTEMLHRLTARSAPRSFPVIHTY